MASSSSPTTAHNRKDQPEWLRPYISTNDIQAGPLITTIYDLSLSVGWKDLRILSIPPLPLPSSTATENAHPEEGWVILIGHKRKEDPLRAVLPIPLHTTCLKPSLLSHIFQHLSSITYSTLPDPSPLLAPTIDQLQIQIQQSTTPIKSEEQSEEPKAEESEQMIDYETLYTAIVNDDSTVVYYKLSKGIKKPADIPDE